MVHLIGEEVVFFHSYNWWFQSCSVPNCLEKKPTIPPPLLITTNILISVKVQFTVHIECQ